MTYKTIVTVQEPNQLVLTGLPFHAGQRVEVVVVAEDQAGTDRVAELRALLAETQALPQARSISDAEIAAEVAAYRAGRG